MPSTRPTESATEQRHAVRFDTALPVGLAGAEGTVQNLSASGVCFEAPLHQEVGALVNLTLEYTLGGERHQLACEGRVVRVEPKGDRVAVAVNFNAPFFGDTEHVEAKPAPAGATRKTA